MINNNFSTYGIKMAGELVHDILNFPVWWYSKGLLNLLITLKKFLVDKQKSLALTIWVKNIFRPMYAQYDWQGMLISFFMRLFQILVRSLFMLFWLFFCLLIIGIWLMLPLFVIYEIIFQIAL